MDKISNSLKFFCQQCLQTRFIDIQSVRKVTVHSYIYYNAVYIGFVSIDAEYGFH